MATSFAAYASQYLNRQNNNDSALSSSQPMFFSFTTDNESRAGHDTDLDDLDDPHIGESEASRAAQNHGDDDEDPYIRLDEDERTAASGFALNHQTQRVPLFRPNDTSSVSSSRHGGWLAHLASSPFGLSRSRSPSQSSTSSDSGPPPDVFTTRGVQQLPPPPSTSRQPASLSLTQSLLPRDGRERPIDVFSLPDLRHTPRNRRKYNDSIWTVLWLAGVSLCLFFSILLLFLPYDPVNRDKRFPYTTFLHTVPMLTILTLLSALVSYTHIFLLRIFVKPVMVGTSVFIPATLFISAVWAFVGSFTWDSEQGEDPTWGETVGLRLFSLIPLALSILTARRLLHLPRDIHVTSSTLTLTTHLLIANPFLLALSPAILLVALIGSIPFLTLTFRLLLYGYAGKPGQGSSAIEGHLHGWANWAIFGTVTVWLWSWGVARGILRMACASVIGAWYFADQNVFPPPPMSTHTIHAAVVRSTGPSLGTICVSALILTIIRLLTLFTLFLNRLPAYIPLRAFFLVNGIRLLVGYLDSVTTALSKYVLVYSGLTGDPFMPSARRAKALTASLESGIKRGRKNIGAEPPLTLLTVAPLTLSFPFALLTYLFVAHTLNSPSSALAAAVLAGTVTALVGLFCVGLVKDTADTLYICYCIDKDIGEQKREEVFIIFEYETQNQIPSRTSRGRQRQGLSAQPEEIMPLPPRSPPQRTNQLLSPHQQQYRQPPSRVTEQRALQQLPTITPPLSAAAVAPVHHINPPKPLSQRSPVAVVADDLDPFQLSYAEEQPAAAPEPVQPLSRSQTPSPTPSLQLDLHPKPQQQQAPIQPEKQVRRKTSAELNMKSHVWDPKKRQQLLDQSDESSDEGGEPELHKRFLAGSFTKAKVAEGQSGRRSDSLKRGETGSGSERGQGSSQFFPGSGFF